VTGLIRYEAALHALAECVAVDEVKEFADKAAAMQAYARMSKDRTMEVQAGEIRIRAERRLGELILAQKETGGLAKPGPKSLRSAEGIPTLGDAGISYNMSSRAQQLASVPAEEFEERLAGWRERSAADGERVVASLIAKGKRVQAESAGQEGPPEPLPMTELQRLQAENEELRDRLAEMGRQCAELMAENEALAKVVDADDRATAALEQLRISREREAGLQSRIDGLMNERNANIRQIKALQRKLGERR